jgi:AcrR family transcriptional regulator
VGDGADAATSMAARIGRPRDLRRRAAVITATREQLTSRGDDDITLSRIARQAGVSRPFVYEHWGSKFA